MGSTSPKNHSASQLEMANPIDELSVLSSSPTRTRSPLQVGMISPRILTFPNDIWYMVRDQLALITDPELMNEDEDCNVFTAWLRSLRLVSQTFNGIFTPLGYRTLVLASNTHVAKFVDRPASMISEWEKFTELVANRTVAIKTSLTISIEDSIEVSRCICEAQSLRVIFFPFRLLLPVNLRLELAPGQGSLLQSIYLRAFLKRSTMCRVSAVTGYIRVEEVTSYDPYLRLGTSGSSVKKDSHENILDIAESSLVTNTKKLVRGVELLHIKVLKPLRASYRLSAECKALSPIRVLILENFEWNLERSVHTAPKPWNLSRLESLTMKSVDLLKFFSTVYLVCIHRLQRLVIIDCIHEPEDRALTMKPWIHNLLPNLPDLEELVIRDDWPAYIEITDFFNFRTRLRSLDLTQSYHLGKSENQESDQMSVADLKAIRRACPDLQSLTVNLDMSQKDEVDKFIQSIGEFRNLEILQLEAYSNLDSTPIIPEPGPEDEIETDDPPQQPAPMATEEPLCPLYSQAKQIISQLHHCKFGLPLRKVSIKVAHWTPPSGWEPASGVENAQMVRSHSEVEGHPLRWEIFGTVSRTLVSYEGGDVEEEEPVLWYWFN